MYGTNHLHTNMKIGIKNWRLLRELMIKSSLGMRNMRNSYHMFQ